MVRNCLPDPQGPKVVDVADVLNRVVPVVLFWHPDHHLIAGPNVTKLFTTVSYECWQKARVFVPGKIIQLSLMLLCKPGAYQSEASSGAPF